jgi:hypothetical protein
LLHVGCSLEENGAVFGVKQPHRQDDFGEPRLCLASLTSLYVPRQQYSDPVMCWTCSCKGK